MGDSGYNAIDFSDERWESVKANCRKMWDRSLGRPLIYAVVDGFEAGRAVSAQPCREFAAQYSNDVSAEDIVDAWEYSLSQRRFYGDAFPQVFPNFGPGVIAAFMGASLVTGEDTVWFHPTEQKELEQISFGYESQEVWFQRVIAVMRAATARWNGRVQVAMTDLGGNLDILSTFRPSEKLIFDLYDYPEAVKRVNWEAHEMWWRYFEDLNGVLQPVNPGYSTWSPVFSESPFYMLQCDFCYMISPEMFGEFVKPELAESCRRLDHSFYHLDGPGQLSHLDNLLEIEELDGVQWIPGAGAPAITEWPEVFRKISDAGKLIQFYGSLEELDIIIGQTGRNDNIICITECQREQLDVLEDGLRKHGVV